MILKLIRWFRGYVTFLLVSDFPERFINLCSINGVNLWNTVPDSKGLVSCMTVSDYRRILRIAKKSKGVAKIKSRHGVPFIVEKYKGRYGIAAGGVLSILLFFFLSSFIWSVNIIGADSLGETQIMNVLEKNGLTVGTYKGNVNVQQIQRSTIIDLPEIGWMSINIQDCCANVELKEKAPVPRMSEDTSPCNIVASKDGVITDYQISQGKSEVMRGSAVTEGQMLVNSVMENQMGGVEFSHAKAKIFADVEQTKSFSMNMENYVLFPSGKYADRYALSFFNLCIPVTVVYSGYSENYLQKDSYRVFSGINYLPLGTDRQREIEYSYTEINFTEEQVRKALLKEMSLYEIFCKNESTVVSRGFSGGCAEGRYTLNVSYVFNEDIAKEQELYISE